VSYRGRVEKLFLPAFGKVPLDKLAAKHVLAMFAAIDVESERITTARSSPDPETRKTAAGKRPTGISTKRRILAVLSSALGDACSAERRLLTVNVADGIKFGRHQKGRGSRVQPKLWTGERESAWKRAYAARAKGLGPRERFEAWRSAPAKPGPVMVWRPDQLGAFLDAARSSRLYALFCLLAYGALRRGEACGLRWEETDLEAKRVLVGEVTVVQVGKRVLEQGEAKTDDSKDWLTIADEAITPLQAWRMQQEEERLAWEDAWQDTGYCFTQPDGTVVGPEQVSGAFERLAFDAGLPPVSLRDLRHCAPTYALAAGEDIKVVSAMMRHTSVKITADTYALILPDLAASVSRAVASMVPRGAVRNL
jgi:integrase